MSHLSTYNIFIGYGKCAEDVSRHKNTLLFGPDANLQSYFRKATFQGHEDIETEDGSLVRELTMRKKRIWDDKPVHVGVAILQWSKLIFLRYLYLFLNIILAIIYKYL